MADKVWHKAYCGLNMSQYNSKFCGSYYSLVFVTPLHDFHIHSFPDSFLNWQSPTNNTAVASAENPPGNCMCLRPSNHTHSHKSSVEHKTKFCLAYLKLYRSNFHQTKIYLSSGKIQCPNMTDCNFWIADSHHFPLADIYISITQKREAIFHSKVQVKQKKDGRRI